jgi:hypothetical protein
MPTPIKQCPKRGRYHGPHDVGIDNDTVLRCPGTDMPATGQFEVSDSPLAAPRETPPPPPSGIPLVTGVHPMVGAAQLSGVLNPGRKCRYCGYIKPTVEPEPTSLSGAQEIRARALDAAAGLYLANAMAADEMAIIADAVLIQARLFEAYITTGEPA